MIYAIVCTHTHRVKIGYTGSDPARRLAELQTGSPTRLRLGATCFGDRELEGWLHRRLADRGLRSHGEWFFPSPEVDEVVRILAGATRPTSQFGSLILDDVETWARERVPA